MATKTDYVFKKLKGLTSMEYADPSNRLRRGETLTSGIEFKLSADGTQGSLKVKPLPVKSDLTSTRTYEGATTGMYVVSKSKGGVSFGWPISKERLSQTSLAVARNEACEAVDEVFHLLFSKATEEAEGE